MQARLGYVAINIEPLPASEWVAALLDDNVIAALLDLFGEDVADDVYDMLADGAVDLGTLNDAIYDIITVVSGRPWWFTVRLIHMAAGGWDTIGGDLAVKGIRADMMPFATWMDALLQVVMDHISPDDRTSVLARLNASPAGVAPAINEKAEEDTFRAYMSSGS